MFCSNKCRGRSAERRGSLVAVTMSSGEGTSGEPDVERSVGWVGDGKMQASPNEHCRLESMPGESRCDVV